MKRSIEDKRALIIQYHTSGLSRVRFAKSIGIAPSTFCAWVNSVHLPSCEVSKEAAESPRPTVDQSHTPAVVELVTTPSPRPPHQYDHRPELILHHGKSELVFFSIPSASDLAELLGRL